MSGEIPLTLATSVLLADGWHAVSGSSLGVASDQTFISAVTGLLISPGGPWMMWIDPDGTWRAGPLRAVYAVQLAAAVLPALTGVTDPFAAVTSVQLPDGEHATGPGGLLAVNRPVFLDAAGRTLAPGDLWFQVTGTSGEVLACPERAVAGIILSGPLQVPEPETPPPLDRPPAPNPVTGS